MVCFVSINKEWVRERFPVGTRIELVSMHGETSVPAGSRGTVVGIDDLGTLLMQWDCGSTLGLIHGADEWFPIEEGVM